jgi:hypothetical protein
MVCCDRCKDKVLGEYRIGWTKGFNALQLDKSIKGADI